MIYRRGGCQPVDEQALVFCMSGGYVTQDEWGPGYERVYRKIGEILGKGFYECNISCDVCPTKAYNIPWKNLLDFTGSTTSISDLTRILKYAEDRTNIGYEIRDAFEKNDSKLAEKLLLAFKQV